MRGCLFVLVLAAALLAAVAWFAPGPIASTVIAAVLGGSGYRATSSTITATADPPPRLLFGQADEVSLTGTNVDWRGIHARQLALTLDNVDLFGRTAGAIRGSLDDVRIEDGKGGAAEAATIRLAGPADAADATILVDPATVRTAVITAAVQQFGLEIRDVQLVQPDRLRLETPFATLEGRLVIDANGALALDTQLGSVPLVTIDPSVPLRLRSVSVVDGGLRLEAVLDVESLLRE